MKKNSTLSKIITPVNTQYGAPMGRYNRGRRPLTGKVYDCAVPMSSDGCYDRMGAYWGHGRQLRVAYTKDLAYVEFYRREWDHMVHFEYIPRNLLLTTGCVDDCSHAGRVDPEVEDWVKDPFISNQLDKMQPDDIRKELKRFGAWSDEELDSDIENRKRLLWLAACEVSESDEFQNKFK